MPKWRHWVASHMTVVEERKELGSGTHCTAIVTINLHLHGICFRGHSNDLPVLPN